MTKQGDGPTTRRRGYGYREAQQAGIPWQAVAPRPVSEINAELEARHADRKDIADQVAKLVDDHPHLRQRAQEMDRLRWAPADILWQLKQEAAANRFDREMRSKGKKR